MTLSPERLVARFGPWTCETPVANVRAVCRTGPYRWFKAIGARGSLVDRGLTFGTTTAAGVCVLLREPVPGLVPVGAVLHPGITLTLAEPERFAASLRRTRGPGVNGRRRRVLVAGATGYIGRRLVAELVAGDHEVRCLARTPDKLDAEPWRPQVEVVTGDVLDPASLVAAFRDIDAAYYLVHSIGSQSDWRTRDRTAAENFRDAAASAGVEQIVYLGGLGDDAGGALSPHLASRHEVGRVLAAGSVPLTELRAAVVIGSGSASFEMLRHLVEVLPVMTTPRWVETRVQPIAVRDVLAYLTGVLGNGGRVRAGCSRSAAPTSSPITR